MSKQKLPKGWTQKKVHKVIEQYENQTGAEAVAEMQDAFETGRGYRTMHVPIEVEKQVLRIIATVEKSKTVRSSKSAGQIAEGRKRYGK